MATEPPLLVEVRLLVDQRTTKRPVLQSDGVGALNKPSLTNNKRAARPVALTPVSATVAGGRAHPGEERTLSVSTS